MADFISLNPIARFVPDPVIIHGTVGTTKAKVELIKIATKPIMLRVLTTLLALHLHLIHPLLPPMMLGI